MAASGALRHTLGATSMESALTVLLWCLAVRARCVWLIDFFFRLFEQNRKAWDVLSRACWFVISSQQSPHFRRNRAPSASSRATMSFVTAILTCLECSLVYAAAFVSIKCRYARFPGCFAKVLSFPQRISVARGVSMYTVICLCVGRLMEVVGGVRL